MYELSFKILSRLFGLILCGLKLMSERTCMLVSGNEAVNFEGLQF